MSSATYIASTHTPALLDRAIAQAVDLLRAGDVVALPTETVYGLAANALNAEAVRKIFSIKGRPAGNPLIVHVADVEMARGLVVDWDKQATRLAEAFWPGPLTLVLHKSPPIPDVVTAGGRTVGLRWPSHPVIQAVIRACGFPLAAPSANLSMELSPTTAEHVRRGLDGRIPLIIDGGPSQVGVESTVLDLSTSPPQILRPGMIHAESLEAVIGAVASTTELGAGALRSPGLLRKHYSPKARLIVCDGEQATLATELTRSKVPPERVHWLIRRRPDLVKSVGPVSVMPGDAGSYARALYAELHRADAAGAELIVVEAVPKTPEWQAIRDRLRRASA